jgi:RND family efflux transporter MFP subunit
MKFARYCIGVSGALLALLLTSCGKPDAPKAERPAAPARAVRIARAEMRPMERTLQVVGSLSAHEETTVAAQVAGQIESYRVDLGDHVATGQELARIDTTAYDALARQSAANLAKATASAANAAQNLKRVQELQKDKIASGSDLDLAVAEADQAQAEVKAVEAADAVARLNLERSRVRAPFDGAVAERIASVGAYAPIGAPIVKFVKTDPLRLRLEVPERDSILVRPGQVVRVTVEGDTNVYAGALARVAPAIRESSRMLLVEADVRAQGSLRPGLFARAQIVVSAGEPALSVPANTLITFAGLEKVVAVVEGKALEKTVVTGRHGDGWVEIVSGLDAGQAVVLDPTGLRTGQPLTIATPASGQTTATMGGPSR